ncbi:sulfate ABC transporter permease subunit CysT [Cardiobacterium sp. Marseille-Q4385]|mgnify:FL=1|uniref:sulfate ABC transporter permease subunit CysT n=1 Tax=Cardiobacterium sp. Marseille-Q4385 TaxID=2866573 RepID=UPI001CE3C86C|nr:sulfate ABC transporter permease subunit CysT [Cardiobacterium sp. Marseille-Q4385]
MSPVSTLPRPRRLQVLPGFGLSLGLSLFFVALVLLLPLTGLVMNVARLSLTDYWAVISDAQVLAAFRVTLWAAAWASLVNAVCGLLLAWVLVRYRFFGRGMVDALVDLPFALPTAVAGIALAALFAADGWLGRPLAALGVQVAFQPLGIVVAMVFTSIPFVVRAVQPVLEALPRQVEEAAATLGARPWQVFCRVILPLLSPALVSGVVLSFARSLGEFGAVIFIAGNQPFVSKVVSLVIFERLQEFDMPAAAALASVMLALSLLLLLVVNVWQGFFLRRFGRA